MDHGEILLEGVVVVGDKRGRELGFPTANVAIGHAADLLDDVDDGVYAGWLERSSGERHVAAISVGTRPTYYSSEGERLVEAYLLDFGDDLYGESVRIAVLVKVRDQARFATSEELVAQMHRDVAAVRKAATDFPEAPLKPGKKPGAAVSNP